MARWTLDDYKRAVGLMESGAGTFRASRITGIPRATLRYWRRIGRPPATISRPAEPSFDGWRPTDAEAYCYLLGLYLGDGCISTPVSGRPRLAIYLDARYPSIVTAAAVAVQQVAPDARVCIADAPGCVVVCASHGAWIAAFPQHGPGRKHTRPIELTAWQRHLTQVHPEALLLGLFHSDGSRCVNRFQTMLPSGRLAAYQYVRYFFTNYSADIRDIFCAHCDLLGIEWTQSSFKNISIAKRRSVALLDSFAGPKR